MPRLGMVRDAFIFCCYTGLAFFDVEKLSEDDIVTDIKMLGHRSLKTTQIYAKVINQKVERDMEILQKQIRLAQENRKD